VTRAALVLDAARSRLVDLDPLPLGDDDVRIAVAYAGICGSELHAIRSGTPYAGGDEHGALTFGHEYSGTVIETGAAVGSVREGQDVTCLPRIHCLRCDACRGPATGWCESFSEPPRWGLPVRGAWAEEIVVPSRVVVPLPVGLSLRDAALCEPLACALRGVDQARAPAGHTAVVIGGGPIGLLAAALSMRAGARLTLVSEPRAVRRAIAERLGAIAVDPVAGSLPATVAEATEGCGPDVVYEAVGHPETLREATELAARGGTVVVLGVASPDAAAAIRPWRVFERELTIVGAHGPERTFHRALDWLPRIDVDAVVSHVLPLRDVSTALELCLAGDAGKVLVTPGDR
jgi:threonine dehydrogenase-like Zn-dependent dehydrogenase